MKRIFLAFLLALGASAAEAQIYGPVEWQQIPSSAACGLTANTSTGVISCSAAAGANTAVTFNRPAGASFGFLNQNSATLTDNANGPLVLQSTVNNGGNDDLSCASISVPGSGNWTYTVNAQVSGLTSSSAGAVFPLGISDGTKFQVMGVYQSGSINAPGLIVTHYSAHNVGVGNDYAAAPGFFPNLAWWRIFYNATGPVMTWSASVDGVNWFNLVTATTPYLTPSKAVMCVDTKNNNGMPIAISIKYWVQS